MKTIESVCQDTITLFFRSEVLLDRILYLHWVNAWTENLQDYRTNQLNFWPYP